MPGIHGFSRSTFHPSMHDLHDEASHPSGTKPHGSEEGPSVPLVLKPAPDPFPPASTGVSSSTPVKSLLRKVTRADQSGDYVVNMKDTPDANGTRPVYRLSDDIGAPQATHERAKTDGHGGWTIANEVDSNKPASGSTLPPAAKIDPRQLGPLNDKRVYPGGDGNSYVRRGNDYRQVIYDQQIKGWRMVDPDRPNDLSRSVPVALDGDGGATPLPKAALKGGSFPKTKAERVAEAQAAVNQTQAKKETTYAAKQEALHRYQQIEAEKNGATRQLLEAENKRDGLIRGTERLQHSLRREEDPVQREGLQARLSQAEQQTASVKQEIAALKNELRSIDVRLSDAAADRMITAVAYAQAWQDHFYAERRLAQAYQAAA